MSDTIAQKEAGKDNHMVNKTAEEESEREEKIWDLPPFLAGKIVSYKTSTTADVAKVSGH